MAKAQKSIKRVAASRKATTLQLPISPETKATLLWLTEAEPSPVDAMLARHPDALESRDPKVKRALQAAYKEAAVQHDEMRRREQDVAGRYFSRNECGGFSSATKISSTDDLVLAAASALFTSCANRNGVDLAPVGVPELS